MPGNCYMNEWAINNLEAQWQGDISNVTREGQSSYSGDFQNQDNSGNQSLRHMLFEFQENSELKITERESHQVWTGTYTLDSGVYWFDAVDTTNTYSAKGHLEP